MDSSSEHELQKTTSDTAAQADLVREVFSLSPTDCLERILSLDHPQALVRNLSRVDFYWLVKKVGEEDSLPLLQLASNEQWQHLMDMELWKKDRLGFEAASAWITRLYQADPRRLVQWLSSEGEHFSFLYFSKMIRVQLRRTDEVYDVEDGFVSFDNIFFFKVLHPEHEEPIRGILQLLAAADHERYQALLLGLQGTLASDLEEEVYRLRNVRLAEDGFLPYEEALSIYSRLRPGSLRGKQGTGSPSFSPTSQEGVLVPMTPILYAEKSSFLAESAARISDPLFMDRIRLEFAGLCNQVIAADGLEVTDLEVLLKVCRKASGYISLGLEKVSDKKLPVSEDLLRNNSLADIFRVGYGLALELKWDAEQWMKKAWFARKGFGRDFWEEHWGGVLSGLSLTRPRLYVETHGGEPYKDFENVLEIDECRANLKRMMILDLLLESLASQNTLKPVLQKRFQVTFSALIFTYWARQGLDVDPGFAPLSSGQLRELFRKIRKGRSKPPYRLADHEEAFIRTFRGCASGVEDALSHLWQRFVEEYALVETEDLDPRFVKHLLVAED